MLKASFKKYILGFHQPAITSRSVLTEKETYFIKIWNENNPDCYGLGECAIFRGLSSDDIPDYEDKLKVVCDKINDISPIDIQYSSIRFGVETALNDIKNGGNRIIFTSPWTQGYNPIPINGLIWMGKYDEMLTRIISKIESGFNCIKLKIGGIEFNKELKLLKFLRSNFSDSDLQIRLDANGAFLASDALFYLEKLSKYKIHSIEQPIKQGQWNEMVKLVKNSPINIALDEELIGINTVEEKRFLLETISPQYIILKPSLCGGFSGADEWIRLAAEQNVGWWATSALESNIGLNAIAQWVSTYSIDKPQGLGTGMLYNNNIDSPIEQTDDILIYNQQKKWNIPRSIL